MRRLFAITVAALAAASFLLIPSRLMAAAFEAAPDAEFVQSSARWTAGATISLTVEDGSGVVYSDTQTANGSGDFLSDFYALFDLQRGDVVTVSDGTQTKTHTVRNLFVDVVALAADTVEGRADAGTGVDVSVYGNGSLSVTTDGSGKWVADFSGMTDLTSFSEGDARQADDDGDSTLVLRGAVRWLWTSISSHTAN